MNIMKQAVKMMQGIVTRKRSDIDGRRAEFEAILNLREIWRIERGKGGKMFEERVKEVKGERHEGRRE